MRSTGTRVEVGGGFWADVRLWARGGCPRAEVGKCSNGLEGLWARRAFLPLPPLAEACLLWPGCGPGARIRMHPDASGCIEMH